VIEPLATTIPSSPGAGHARRGGDRVPSRAELRAAARRPVKLGARTKADLYVVDVGRGPVLIKDFAAKPAWVRLLGRLQVARECGAYRRLAGLSGPPAFHGRVDAHALALEYVDARPLSQTEQRAQQGPVCFDALSRIVHGLHAAGVAHLDLRRQDNVLLDREGRVRVVDFASALWLRPGGPWHRRLFGLLRFTDETALLKWKQLLGAGTYTESEQALLRRHDRWRVLWPFNRKH
jgi:hypothetical protein